jgi:hypothetical protein
MFPKNMLNAVIASFLQSSAFIQIHVKDVEEENKNSLLPRKHNKRLRHNVATWKDKLQNKIKKYKNIKGRKQQNTVITERNTTAH